MLCNDLSAEATLIGSIARSRPAFFNQAEPPARSFSAGSFSTILIVSMLTRITRPIKSMMYRGWLCARHQSFGSLTMPLSL